MKYTIAKIKAYRKHVNTLEKIISIPAKIAVVIGGYMAIYPMLEHISNGAERSDTTVPFFGAIVTLKILSYSILGYFIATVAMWLLLFLWKKSKESIGITKGLLLGIFAADLYFLSLWLYIGAEPLESNLFWLYCLIVVRNVIYFPKVVSQVILTIAIMICYAGTYIMRVAWSTGEFERVFSTEEVNALGLRIIILVLVNLSAWGLFAIYQRRMEVEDEMQERTIRTERLNLAGLVAKETAHSLKNPLAIINNACFLLGRNIQEKQQEDKNHLKIIKDQVNRADGIIKELTKYSELASGRIEKADVNKEIEKCIKDLEYEIRERGIEIKKNLNENVPMLMIENTQLRQILSNIILNACEAIKKNGRIRIMTKIQKDGNIRIEIEDNGQGMDEIEKEKIFKAYYTTKEGGTGIGLSIVHTVVQAYNGTIDVESKVGEGSKFTILFPTRTERVK